MKVNTGWTVKVAYIGTLAKVVSTGKGCIYWQGIRGSGF